MAPAVHMFILGALAATMASGAPVSNHEKLVNVEQAGESVDRAKRAQEEIVFGNQQNKARVMAKKSDLSNIIPAPEPSGERDLGSEGIVHKVVPVSEDLAARAEAAVGSASENNEKMNEAVEAAIEWSLAEPDSSASESSAQDNESKEQANKQLSVDEIEDGEQGTGEANEEKIEENDDDKNLKELQKVSSGTTPNEGDSNTEENTNEGSEPEVKYDNKEGPHLLSESSKDGQERGDDLDRDRERSYENRMRDYLLSIKDWRGLPFDNYPLFSRYRRSLASAQKVRSLRNKRVRRIKRDLLDDGYYGQYERNAAPYTSEDINDALISRPEEYTPLSDDEAEYLYNHLVNYLANNYVPENPSLEETPLDSYLNGYDDDEDDLSYTPYEIYNEDSAPLVSSNPYEDSYSYEPVELDSYQNYAKRGMIDYYPNEVDEEEDEKRYFFPFSEEPETHWGAFVPEKRDYGEAIQRLQRLAMALSDNPGPYYRELVEDYRRK